MRPLYFTKVIYYSVMKGQYQHKFVGLSNYIQVITNQYFLLAVKNTLLQIIICVPIFALLSIVLSIFYIKSKRIGRIARSISVFPMVVPSVCIISIYNSMFSWMDSPIPIYIIYIWKYIGFGIILLSAAIAGVKKELYEAAKIDGANEWKQYTKITLPLCSKTIRFIIILGIVYVFRIFRESYLYYQDNYPPDYSYNLQYYLNNQFLKLNYQAMSASSIIITVFILFIIILLGRSWKKNEDA